MKLVKFAIFFLFSLSFALYYGFRQDLTVVHGQGGSTLAAPTGVTASDGAYNNKVGVLWDAIRGATLYRIFRNTTNNTATASDVGTTQANYFFDPTGAAGQDYFYWVRAENGGAMSAFSQPDQGRRVVGTIEPVPFPALEPPPAPSGNPVTAAKTFLGKTLFWDEQLSSTRTVSCGTCHHAGNGGSDPRSKTQVARATNPGPDGQTGTADDVVGSPGIVSSNADGSFNSSATFGLNEQVTGRKANSFVNAAYTNALFWDGRATEVMRDPITNEIVLPAGAALESQILGPPVSEVEMGHVGRNWGDVAGRVTVSIPLALSPSMPVGLRNWIDNRNYPQLFEEAFGTPAVTPARIALAIATYERTLFSDQTPLDRAAMQIEALTPLEEAGLRVFTSNVCNLCHAGSLFSDDSFHNIGVRPINEDAGRFILTGTPDFLSSFRTPGLRNVELRGPFMHNGRLSTLEDVIEFYNRGGDFDAPNINRNVIRQMELSPADKASLLAFLKRPFTDPRVAAELPPFDRPALYLESNRVPVVSGTGRAGAGNLTPKVTALEPPVLGNPKFTVGVADAAPGASAVLVIDDNDPGVGAAIPATGSLARVTVNLSGTGAGRGFGSVSLALPAEAAFVGRAFSGRWYVTDPAAVNGFSVSPVFRFTIFAPAFTPAVIPTPAPQPTPTPDVSAPKVQFAQPGAVVAEDYTSVTLTVSRSGNTAAPASVGYRSVTPATPPDCNVASGEADQRCDYALASGTLNFAAGQTSRSFTVIINEDNYVEGPETFTIELINPAGATLGTNPNVKVAIADDDMELPANPIDAAPNFVQQQYHDFLSRRPDTGGLSFWTGQITQCGTDAACIYRRRYEVSNAFFFELEYQRSGAFVYRLYRAAFGNTQPFPNPGANSGTPILAAHLPAYEVFAPDRARVDAANLAASQLALANDFVQRTAFTARYPATQTADQFADALIANIQSANGVNLASQRAAMISLVNSSGRGAVLYRLADDATGNPINNSAFIDAEYNRSFVLTQYFGYLRRDPDIGGINFWFGQVNRFPLRDARGQNGMVCGFINSAEYQRRFSTMVTQNDTNCPQ